MNTAEATRDKPYPGPEVFDMFPELTVDWPAIVAKYGIDATNVQALVITFVSFLEKAKAGTGATRHELAFAALLAATIQVSYIAANNQVRRPTIVIPHTTDLLADMAKLMQARVTWYGEGFNPKDPALREWIASHYIFK